MSGSVVVTRMRHALTVVLSSATDVRWFEL